MPVWICCYMFVRGFFVLMAASGIGQMALDYVTYCTAEGDRIILELQCARYLVKAADAVAAGRPATDHACDYLTGRCVVGREQRVGIRVNTYTNLRLPSIA